MRVLHRPSGERNHCTESAFSSANSRSVLWGVCSWPRLMAATGHGPADVMPAAVTRGQQRHRHRKNAATRQRRNAHQANRNKKFSLSAVSNKIKKKIFHFVHQGRIVNVLYQYAFAMYTIAPESALWSHYNSVLLKQS